MKLKILLSSLVLVFLCLIPQSPSLSCDPDDWYLDFYSEYSFFRPDTTLSKGFQSIPAFSFNRIYNYDGFYYNSSKQEKANLEEWMQYFNNQVKFEDLEKLIYKTSLVLTEASLHYLQNHLSKLPDSLTENSVIKYCQTTTNQDFMKYLIYAKECELYADTDRYGWTDDESFKQEEITYLVSEKMTIYNLAQRYGLHPKEILYWNKLPANTYYLPANQKIKIHYAFKEHIVKSEEDIGKIARNYRVRERDLCDWNGISWGIQNLVRKNVDRNKEVLTVGQTIPIYLNPFDKENNLKKDYEEIIYTEKNTQGEFFHAIAWDFELYEEQLKAYNQIGNERKSFPGQKLKVPVLKINHQVQANETIESIAKKYGANEWRLEKRLRKNYNEANQLISNDLRIGQKLIIYKNPAIRKDLLKVGLDAYQNTKANFLKLRYVYQMVRLTHYAGMYERALELYQQLVEPLGEQNSIIKYWVMEQKAGVLANLGRNAEANLLFATIFDKCPSRRRTAYLSFAIKSDEDWLKTMSFCRNNSERASLYFMRAIDPQGDPLAEMRHIYFLEPNSERLNALLIREINKLEFDLLKADLDNNLLFFKNYKGFSKTESIAYLTDLQGFINHCILENKVSKPELWQLASAYTQFLLGKPLEAQSAFQKLAKSTVNQEVVQQAELLGLVLELSQLKKINSKTEEKLFQKTQKFENYQANLKTKQNYYEQRTNRRIYKELLELMQKVFARLYEEKDLGKKILCNAKFSKLELELSSSLSDLNALINFVEKKQKNNFEQNLLQKIAENEGKQLAYLYDLKGILLMKENVSELALQAFLKVPQSEENLLKFKRNPFFKIHKLSWGELKKGEIPLKISTLEIVQKIVDLQKKISNPQINRAEYYFQLGNVHYNMSAFGDFYQLKAKHLALRDTWVGYKYVPIANQTDVKSARLYFEEGMKEAIAYGDYELAAKCCFGAAECEYEELYQDKNFIETIAKIKTDKEEIQFLNGKQQYFKDMQSYFRHTDYYQKVLAECTYFNEFVKRN